MTEIEGFRETPASAAPIKRPPGRPSNASKALRGAEDAAAIRPPQRVAESARDSRREADEYAQLLLDSGMENFDESDEFYIPQTLQPPGWAYQWKAAFVGGMPNSHHMMTLRRAGWREVPASRHPELMPLGDTSVNIEKKGLLLMELPEQLVDRQQRSSIKLAREALKTSEQLLDETPPNTAPRDEFPREKRKLQRQWERGEASAAPVVDE